MKRKVLITAIVTVILAVSAMIFGITYNDEDVEKIAEGIDTVVEIIVSEETQEIAQDTIEATETRRRFKHNRRNNIYRNRRTNT